MWQLRLALQEKRTFVDVLLVLELLDEAFDGTAKEADNQLCERACFASRPLGRHPPCRMSRKQTCFASSAVRMLDKMLHIFFFL